MRWWTKSFFSASTLPFPTGPPSPFTLLVYKFPFPFLSLFQLLCGYDCLLIFFSVYECVLFWGECLGVPHLRQGEVPPQGGKPGWAAPPDPRIGPWLRLLKRIAESHNLVPEFEVLLHVFSSKMFILALLLFLTAFVL